MRGVWLDTNNYCEGWHRGFSQHVRVSHPSIWRFIECLRREADLCRMDLIHHEDGRKKSRHYDAYQNLKEIIFDHVAQFDRKNFKKFLVKIARTFTL